MDHDRPTLNPAAQRTLDQLGATKDDRPMFESGIGDDVRFSVESGLSELVSTLEEDQLYVSKSMLERVLGCEGKFLAERDEPFEWKPVIARGVIAHKAIELQITRPQRTNALDLIDEALEITLLADTSLGEWLEGAQPFEIDELRSQANASLTQFLETWPPISRKWKPALEQSIRVELFDRRVVMSGKPDLTLGTANGPQAGKVIVDFKTGGKQIAHRADLRFYAVLDTIRVGTPPRLLASSYLAMGELEIEPVTENVLEAGVKRIIEGTKAFVELRDQRRDPVLKPSASCRWCPLNTTCDAALESDDDDL